jgi:CRISPR/Cas system-associated exonuclease Cas4 (RecB family)
MVNVKPEVLIRYHQNELQDAIKEVLLMSDDEVLEAYGDGDDVSLEGVYSKPGRLRCSRDLNFMDGCVRKTMIHTMNIVIPSPFSKQTRVTFARGTGVHEAVQKLWVKYGLIPEEDIEVPFKQELPAIGEGWRLSGTLDGIFTAKDDTGEEERIVIELKTTACRPQSLPLSYHHGQVTAYMEFTSAPRTWVYYIHKGFGKDSALMGSMFAFEFKRNRQDQERLLEHLREIKEIAQGTKPMPKPMEIKECKWCEFREYCYGK